MKFVISQGREKRLMWRFTPGITYLLQLRGLNRRALYAMIRRFRSAPTAVRTCSLPFLTGGITTVCDDYE